MQGLLAVNPCKRPRAASQSAFWDHLPVRLHGVLEPQRTSGTDGPYKGAPRLGPGGGQPAGYGR
jgi:hypothetical protein